MAGAYAVDADAPIAGAGPIGLSLADAPARLGTSSVVAEARAGSSTHTRAANPMPGTPEPLDVLGLAAPDMRRGRRDGARRGPRSGPRPRHRCRPASAGPGRSSPGRSVGSASPPRRAPRVGRRSAERGARRHPRARRRRPARGGRGGDPAVKADLRTRHVRRRRTRGRALRSGHVDHAGPRTPARVGVRVGRPTGSMASRGRRSSWSGPTATSPPASGSGVWAPSGRMSIASVRMDGPAGHRVRSERRPGERARRGMAGDRRDGPFRRAEGR